MAITTQLTIVGNLVSDPEVRYVNSGKAVVNITIASTARKMNRQTREWEDADPVFVRASAWDELAENIGDSFKKGNRVIAIGVLKVDKFTDRGGNDREVMELQIDEIGPSLKYATAVPEKRGRARNQQTEKKVDSDGWALTNDEDTPF